MEQKDKRLMAALVGALLFALLVIAFLLGRVSAKPADSAKVVAASPIVAPAVVPPSVSTPTPLAPFPESAPPSAPTIESANTLPPEVASILFPSPGPMVPTPPPPAAGSVPASDRAAIGAYFAATDRLEDMGAGDPQAFANSLMQSVSSGDFSSFDNLMTKARTQRDRLRAVSPPRVCAEHHRLALALASDSVSMLERLRAAIQRGDTSALMSMTTEGRNLETKVAQLKEMGDAIKRAAGL